VAPARRSGLILAGLALAFLVSATALGTWIQHMQALTVPKVTVEELTPPAPSLPILAYRLEQLEKRVEKFEERSTREIETIKDQHIRMVWLLVANLAAVLASLVTYLVTRAGRRGPAGPAQ